MYCEKRNEIAVGEEELDEYCRTKGAAEIDLYLMVLSEIIEMPLQSRVEIAINTIEEISSEDLSP